MKTKEGTGSPAIIDNKTFDLKLNKKLYFFSDSQSSLLSLNVVYDKHSHYRRVSRTSRLTELKHTHRHVVAARTHERTEVDARPRKRT